MRLSRGHISLKNILRSVDPVTLFCMLALTCMSLLTVIGGAEEFGSRRLLMQIAMNAGLEGAVILDRVRGAQIPGYGFDADKEEYVDMIAAGIVDPTKVCRSALENAASVASTVLTTEAMVVDIPEPPAAAAAAGGMGGMGGMY